jgi:hypothetical protein
MIYDMQITRHPKDPVWKEAADSSLQLMQEIEKDFGQIYIFRNVQKQDDFLFVVVYFESYIVLNATYTGKNENHLLQFLYSAVEKCLKDVYEDVVKQCEALKRQKESCLLFH